MLLTFILKVILSKSTLGGWWVESIFMKTFYSCMSIGFWISPSGQEYKIATNNLIQVHEGIMIPSASDFEHHGHKLIIFEVKFVFEVCKWLINFKCLAD